MAGPPAFHRRILVTPSPDSVSAWVEDDYHHMGVTLRHDGTTIAHAAARIERAPWSTCPGAEAKLAATFAGVALDDAARRGERIANCTHLHDMALLAAAHARDAAPTRYAIVVTDAEAGIRRAGIARDGVAVLALVEHGGRLVEPTAAAGRTLFELGDWIADLDAPLREAARLLRWAAIVAHGRAIPLARQSDASRMPSTCFTFQPERKGDARRVGAIVDFSAGGRGPLDPIAP